MQELPRASAYPSSVHAYIGDDIDVVFNVEIYGKEVSVSVCASCDPEITC